MLRIQSPNAVARGDLASVQFREVNAVPAGSAVGLSFSAPFKETPGASAAIAFVRRNTPPAGRAVSIAFKQRNAVPHGSLVGIEFTQDDDRGSGAAQYVTVAAEEQTGYGVSSVRLAVQFTSPPGVAPVVFSGPQVLLKIQYLRPNGLSPFSAGNTSIRNLRLQVWPPGFEATRHGVARSWNLRQYLLGHGRSAALFGEAYAQGGVKLLAPIGIGSPVYGRAVVINTTADQTVSVAGVAPPPLTQPGVSPRSIRPPSIYGTAAGFPVVQFPPQPRGWGSGVFGYLSIKDKTQRVRGEGVDTYVTGYASVRDRAQKTLHRAPDVTSVFGDVAARLQNTRTSAFGFESLETSAFAEVRSTRRYVQALGAPPQLIGGASIRNKTPSLAPAGLATSVFGLQDVGWRVRRINAPGVACPSAQAPAPSLWQTPSMRPAGIAAAALPVPIIGLGRRSVYAAGRDVSSFGVPTNGFRYRVVLLEGKAKEASLYGLARLEHGVRTVLVPGALRDGYGTPWVSRSPRVLLPDGVPQPIDRSTPAVGGRRWLFPDGFAAARFGARIIPEIQSVLPPGFAGGWGSATVLNTRRFLRPLGVTTYPQAAQRWGTPKVWNSRQYVSVVFDPDSGLNPPAWPQWTAVGNRNRVLGAAGSAMVRVGAPFVENGARALLPAGAVAPAVVGAGLVAYRVRGFPVGGMEPPYLSRWCVVGNKAVVLRAEGGVATVFGQASAESNRRVLARAGGMDVYAFGNAFVAPRVRGIELVQRYAIAPPYLALPQAQLLTRYVDVAPGGIGPKEVGRASLQVIWRGLIPRWTHRDYVGEPRLHNVTPELRGRGWVAEGFGDAAARLQWRLVGVVQGSTSDLFGRIGIADKRQHITPAGSDYLRFGDKLKVARFGVQPPSMQTIVVAEFLDLSYQVPGPVLNQQVIYTYSGGAQTKWGDALVQSNGIRVEPGYWELLVGEPAVTLKVRRLTVAGFPDGEVFEPPKPRLSPHTIYSVVDAPPQARENHANVRLHYVDSDGGQRPPGSVFGAPAATLRHRRLVVGHYALPPVGPATIFNRRQHVAATGLLSLRFGWPVVPGPQALGVEQEYASDVYGAAKVGYGPYLGPQTVRAAGLAPVAPTRCDVSLRHRKVVATGLASLLMGASRGEKPYAWQSLHVGAPMPTVPEGFATELFGGSWISHRVRGIGPEGFDAFASEYDYMAFHLRMRVRNALDGRPPRQPLLPRGVDPADVGAPSTRMGTHYIRPDGNSDQHRKGVTK